MEITNESKEEFIKEMNYWHSYIVSKRKTTLRFVLSSDALNCLTLPNVLVNLIYEYINHNINVAIMSPLRIENNKIKYYYLITYYEFTFLLSWIVNEYEKNVKINLKFNNNIPFDIISIKNNTDQTSTYTQSINVIHIINLLMNQYIPYDTYDSYYDEVHSICYKNDRINYCVEGYLSNKQYEILKRDDVDYDMMFTLIKKIIDITHDNTIVDKYIKKS